MLQKNNDIFNSKLLRIISIIFNYPNKAFHIRRLAKEVDVSTTTVSNVVEQLLKYQIIKIEKTELTTNIQADLESENYFSYKRLFNLFRLEKTGFIKRIIKDHTPEAVVLFGSFTKGEDTEESDIDILLITKKDIRIDTNQLEKEFNRKVNLHILPNLDKSSAEFKNTLANGIVLYGYVKVI